MSNAKTNWKGVYKLWILTMLIRKCWMENVWEEKDGLDCSNCKYYGNKKFCTTKCETNVDLLLLQELVDKETPMKVDTNTEGVYYRTKYDEDINRVVVPKLNYDCPRCGLNVVIDNEYCPYCGQKLDWSNEN